MEERLTTYASLYAKHFSAHLDGVRLRTGRITERIRIDHPEAAAMVPFIDENRIVMVRQYRYAVDRETLEIPAGKVDPGETPEQCARRELLEETGYSPTRLHQVFSYYPAIGYSNERILIYAASGLRAEASTVDEDEISKVEVVAWDQIFNLITRGIIQDGKTVIGICLIDEYRKRGRLPADFFD